jgi:hypothetical protein
MKNFTPEGKYIKKEKSNFYIPKLTENCQIKGLTITYIILY